MTESAVKGIRVKYEMGTQINTGVKEKRARLYIASGLDVFVCQQVKCCSE